MVAVRIKPKQLKQGDTIGIFSPCSVVDRADVEATTQFLESNGFKVKIHPQTYAEYGSLAGSDSEKISALNDLIKDNSVDAILCARGGHGAMHLLDRLDYDLIANNLKPLIGYSDITAFSHALLNKCGFVTFHGPMAKKLDQEISAPMMIECLQNNWPDNLLSLNGKSRTIKPGRASGHLIGGNLTLLLSLLSAGGDYTLPLDGAILVIEEVFEWHYRYDRFLMSLLMHPDAQKLAGIVLGVTTFPDESEESYQFPRDMVEIVNNIYDLNNLSCPVVIDAPFTHSKPNQIFPIGIQAELNATGETPTLHLLESPFQE